MEVIDRIDVRIRKRSWQMQIWEIDITIKEIVNTYLDRHWKTYWSQSKSSRNIYLSWRVVPRIKRGGAPRAEASKGAEAISIQVRQMDAYGYLWSILASIARKSEYGFLASIDVKLFCFGRNVWDGAWQRSVPTYSVFATNKSRILRTMTQQLQF
jgi:hypothetical protein